MSLGGNVGFVGAVATVCRRLEMSGVNVEMGDAQSVSVERLWLPLGGTYYADSGWLSPPSCEGIFARNSDAVSLASLVSIRCLVLLGEPGMGKSRALNSQVSLTESGEAAEDLRVDLASFSSESRLIGKILEGPEIKRWLNGDGLLCLTLDSFDEAHSKIENLHRLLGEYLGEWACERLLLRIACRTAQWPASMTEILKKRMGAVDAYELLPLRRSDAAAIVSPELNADEFLDAVEAAQVVPLAARPLTLKLLSATYRQSNALPHRTTELYEKGLLTLCDEMNAERRDAIGRATPDAERLLQTASRIAAFSIFGGRSTVWTGPTAEASTWDLTIGDCTTSPIATTQQPKITSELVQDTLRTGIFTGAGPQRLIWSNATFIDFLSARWIVRGGLDAAQVRSIMTSPDGKLPPRVHQLAAWLVALEPAGFSWLITIDPEAFLRGVDIPSAELRAQVVTELLAEARRGNLYHDYTYRFSGLKHGVLAGQLREALSGPNGEECRIAIGIARQCGERTLAPELAEIALNDQVDPDLRISAALAVGVLTGDSPTDALAPLLKFGANVDGYLEQEREELESAALMASWPHAISTAEVFNRLDPRKPRNFVGPFSAIAGTFTRLLSDIDLEPACLWITSTDDWYDDSRLTDLVEAILHLATIHLDRPDAAAAAVRICLKRIDGYAPIFNKHPYTKFNEPTHDERRDLALALLAHASEEQTLGIAPAGEHDSVALLNANDFAWLIDQHARSDSTLRENLAKVIGWIFTPTDRTHIDVVLGLEENTPAASLFAYWRDPVRLASPEANAARDSDRNRREYMAKRRNQREYPDPWVNPRIDELAGKALAGDVDGFWTSCRLVTIRPGTEHYMDEYQPDLSRHPRWKMLSEQTRENLTRAAAIYLRGGDCKPEKWLLCQTRYYPAEAGYQAFLLLLRNRPYELDSLDPDVWKKWAPILVSWTPSLNGAKAEDKRELFAYAIPHAREELTQVLLQLLDDTAARKTKFMREELELLQSDWLWGELINRLAMGTASEYQNDILDSVMSYHPDRARTLLTEWLKPTNREIQPERARDAAVRLLQISDVSWPMFRELMSGEPEFMKDVFLLGSQAYGRRPPELAEEAIGELYAWLIRHFPHEEDPQHEGVYAVGPRDAVASWRDSLLNYLTHLGTVESVSVITSLVEEFSEKQWLKRILVTAKRASRENSWDPIPFQQLDELAAEQTARIVRSEADLFAATLEAFEEIQKRLTGDTPSSSLLWDTHSERPKSEDEVSDFLRNELQTFLRNRGAIINREVQVRRVRKSGMPERTDLRVDAITPGGRSASGENVTIVGEVKGCWNKDIETSIQSQLVERYMADLHTNVGIYIAVWFDLDSWTDTDNRRRSAAKYANAEGLRKVLEAKAADQKLSGSNVAVIVLDASLGRRGSASN